MSETLDPDSYEYDPLQKHRRLWNDTESILSDSMAGIVMMHRNLVYRDNCKAVLRRDYNKMDKKVRIVSGGSLIDGPMYAGFVGPGMLTAAVLGLPENSSPGVPSADSIFEVIQCVAKDEEHKFNEVLLLVHECLEYFLNFMQAKKKAEEAQIPLKLLFIRDEVNFKLNQKPLSPRSPSGILLLYKIAGAMSEEGRSLDEIYYECDEVMKNGIISSIGLYIEKTPREFSQIQICKGDRLSDQDSKRFPVAGTTTKKIVETLMTDLINGNEYHKFPRESQLTVILSYFGGFTELEASIVMKEFLQQSNRYKYKIELILTGSFHTTMEVSGFHLSIFNVSYNQQFLYYLKIPTVAFSWPKSSIREIYSPSSDLKNKQNLSQKVPVDYQNGNQHEIFSIESNSKVWDQTTPKKLNNEEHWNQNEFEKLNNYDNSIQVAPSQSSPDKSLEKSSPEKSADHEDPLSNQEIEQISHELDDEMYKAEILVLAVKYACEAVIACAQKIDALDLVTPQNFEKCGTRLARIALVIINEIQEKSFADSTLADIIYKIAIIFEKGLPDPQAEMYSIFFNVIAQAIEEEEFVESKHWFEAFIAANNAIDEFARGSKISDTLYAATSAFWEVFSKYDSDIIYPLGLAVNAAQNQTVNAATEIKNMEGKNYNDYGFCGFAGAHALGIWMRGAYEGIKRKYSRSTVREKRSREARSDSDDDEDLERASKVKRVSTDDEEVDIYEDL